MSPFVVRAGPERRLARRRPGAALVMALALIILGGVLLVGTAGAAREASRASRSYVSAALGEGRWLTDVAIYLASWNGAMQSLAPGAELTQTIGPSAVGASGEVAVTHLRLIRLDTRRFLLAGVTQVGPDSSVRARHRAALLLQTPPACDSTAPPLPPVALTRWAQHTIY